MRLQEIAEQIGAQLRGDASIAITGIAAFSNATARDLVFLEDAKHAEAALASSAGAFLVGEFDNAILNALAAKRPIVIAKNPRLAFARSAETLHRAERPVAAIHPTAIID